MNRRELLSILPPATGKEVMIVKNQDVDDIMDEVLAAHAKFRPDYDLICGQFAGGPVEKKLYDWCRKNLSYIVESVNDQTTTSPAALLQKGYCDCKGYAGFIAGILDALNRARKGAFDWYFRFALYENLYEDNWHVFIVVAHPDGSDTWIDPVLSGFNKRIPAPDYYTDETVAPQATVKGTGQHQVGCNCPDPRSMPALSGYMGAPTFLAPGHFALPPQPAPAPPVTAQTTQTPVMAFKDAQAGIILPSIPGYPPDLPPLQLTATGRLCFWNWPLWLTNKIWVDYKYVTGTNPNPSIAQPFSTTDWDNTYIRIATKEPLGNATTGKPAYQALVDGYNKGTYLWNYGFYGEGMYWDTRRPYQWIMENIQYYINRYLKNPYKINGLIPYGTNWNDQFKAAIQGGTGKLQIYLENCNFLVQPEGSMNFWDKFYQVAPIIISAMAAIISQGAATPALLLAISNFAIKAGQASQAAAAAAQNPVQGPPILNTTNLTTDLTPKATTTPAGGGALSNAVSWAKAHPIPTLLIAALVIWGGYELSKE